MGFYGCTRFIYLKEMKNELLLPWMGTYHWIEKNDWPFEQCQSPLAKNNAGFKMKPTMSLKYVEGLSVCVYRHKIDEAVVTHLLAQTFPGFLFETFKSSSASGPFWTSKQYPMSNFSS